MTCGICLMSNRAQGLMLGRFLGVSGWLFLPKRQTSHLWALISGWLRRLNGWLTLPCFVIVGFRYCIQIVRWSWAGSKTAILMNRAISCLRDKILRAACPQTSTIYRMSFTTGWHLFAQSTSGLATFKIGVTLVWLADNLFTQTALLLLLRLLAPWCFCIGWTDTSAKLIYCSVLNCISGCLDIGSAWRTDFGPVIMPGPSASVRIFVRFVLVYLFVECQLRCVWIGFALISLSTACSWV